MTHVALSVLMLVLTGPPQEQSASYPVYETDKISADEHVARREALKRHMGPKSIGVFFTNAVHNRNNDVDFMFRADSNFLYLTGFEEPDAALILIPDGVMLGGERVTEILFVNQPNRQSLTWLGYRMGTKNAETLLNFDKSIANTDFGKTLEEVAEASGAGKLFTNDPPSGSVGRMATMASAFAGWRGGASVTAERSWSGFVARAREIKSPAEQRLLKRSVDISVAAHIEAMKSARPGMREYEIGALVKYVFEKNGCESPGYPPIVGSGPNSTILHYNTNRRLMKAGDIICMDTAGEYHGYTADITRTFPVSGKFSPEQRAIYEIVLKACDAGIAACKPGATRSEVGNAVSRVLSDGLMALGIIDSRRELRTYYMHGWGHNIGLDVHDVQPRRTLEPGITLTVEPGIYIKAGSPCDKKWWNIGVRIEDDVLITADGPVNMSAAAPRTVAEIERTMAMPGLGDR
ncbi:MAG: aminopeptidase P N-terminal domain-containing protein [Armatimonadetes bacterium]|nr:aminopeptidase P N-terminal domain-containing protein [Armatimonadota bacterium]